MLDPHLIFAITPKLINFVLSHRPEAKANQSKRNNEGDSWSSKHSVHWSFDRPKVDFSCNLRQRKSR